MFSSLETIASNLGIEKCPRGQEAVLVHIKVGDSEYHRSEFIHQGRSRQGTFGDELRARVFSAMPEATDYTFDVWSRHDYNSVRKEAARIVRAVEMTNLVRMMINQTIMYSEREQ